MYPRSTAGEAFRKLLSRSGRRILHMCSTVHTANRTDSETEKPVVLKILLTLSTGDAGNFLGYAFLKCVLLRCNFVKEKESKQKVQSPVLSFWWISRKHRSVAPISSKFLHVNTRRFCWSPVPIKLMLGLDILLTTAAEDILSIHCHRGKFCVWCVLAVCLSDPLTVRNSAARLVAGPSDPLTGGEILR
jgi:hypothetical protein